MCTYANFCARFKSRRTEGGTRNKGTAVTKQKRGPPSMREGAWSKAEGVQTRENYEDTYI